jgi:hypothetical protein
MRMVRRSTTSDRSKGPRKAWADEPPAEPSTDRSSVNFTAWASKAVPSWNFTPSRSLNVQILPSGEVSHAVARRGFATPAGSSWIKLSKMTLLICTPVAWIGPCGSSVVGSRCMATRTVPPCLGAWPRASRSGSPVASRMPRSAVTATIAGRPSCLVSLIGDLLSGLPGLRSTTHRVTPL